MFMDKIITYISLSSPVRLVFLATFSVLIGSVPLVYTASILFGVEYTIFLLGISVFLPLILTPSLVAVLIRLTTTLEYFKDHLQMEIDKNKAKDTMLFEQARFVLMGEMLANISHQWKQPLNTINLSILNLKMDFSKDEEDIKKYHNIIEDNVNYLGSTIDTFMSFFDKRKSDDLQNICFIVKEVESIIQTHIKEKEIFLEVKMNCDCENIVIASSISQVLLNLLNNSKDALALLEKKKKIELEFKQTEEGLSIFVSDNGRGINEEIREKVFDPYFTTKEKTQGTGIGLYMSKQIINQLFNAEIMLLDRDEKTVFKIEIPYSEKCVVKA